MRTDAMQQAYYDFQDGGGLRGKCPLCDEKEMLQTFTYWQIMPNRFPYDKVAKVHHMLVPLRHASWTELTAEELAEFEEIKRGYVDSHYQYMVEATSSLKSIPAHFHLHLLIATD